MPSAIFPPSVTWVGIVILATGLATGPGNPAHAAGSPVQTASTQWSGLSNAGVLSGGVPVDFGSGQGGWGDPAVDSAGVLGIEWSTAQNPANRSVLNPLQTSLDSDPGGETVGVARGYLSPNPNKTLFADLTVSVSGDQAQWAVALTEMDPDSFDGTTVFLGATLPSGYAPVYAAPAAGTLVVHDANARHPTMVLHAESSAGTLSWGGGATRTAALTDGERAPHVYLSNVPVSSVSLTVTIGLVDHDPCALADAQALASQGAGVYGVVWASLSSCLLGPEWNSVVADGSIAVRELTLDERIHPLTDGATREVSIQGLPPGVSATLVQSEAFRLVLDVSADPATVPGDYPLEVVVRTRAPLGSQPEVLEPMATSTLLQISEPPPPPEPEPEPAPEPEPDLEPEPEPEPEPEVPVATEEDAREPDDAVDLAGSQDTGETPSDDDAPLVEDSPVAPEPAVSPTPLAIVVIEPEPATQPVTRSGSGVPPMSGVVAADTETSPTPAVVSTQEPTPEQPESHQTLSVGGEIPEPTSAAAWVGVSALGAGVGWWLWGILRRRSDDHQWQRPGESV